MLERVSCTTHARYVMRDTRHVSDFKTSSGNDRLHFYCAISTLPPQVGGGWRASSPSLPSSSPFIYLIFYPLPLLLALRLIVAFLQDFPRICCTQAIGIGLALNNTTGEIKQEELSATAFFIKQIAHFYSKSTLYIYIHTIGGFY